MAFKINNTDISTLFANGSTINPNISFLLSTKGYDDGKRYVRSGRTSASEFPAWCNTPITNSTQKDKYKSQGSSIPFADISNYSVPGINTNSQWLFWPLESSRSVPFRTTNTQIKFLSGYNILAVQDLDNNNVVNYNNYSIKNGLFLFIQAGGGGGGGACNGYITRKRCGGGGGASGAGALVYINLEELGDRAIFVEVGNGGQNGGNSWYPSTGGDGKVGGDTVISVGTTFASRAAITTVYGGNGGKGGTQDGNRSYGGTGRYYNPPADNYKNLINVLIVFHGKEGGISGELNIAGTAETKKAVNGYGWDANSGTFTLGITNDTFSYRRRIGDFDYTGVGGIKTTATTDGISEGGGGGASLFSINGGGQGMGGSGGVAFGGGDGVGKATDGTNGALYVILPGKTYYS